MQFVRHGPHVTGEEKVWQEKRSHRANGTKAQDPHILISKVDQEMWASENIALKVYNDHTASTTTTLNSKYDPMASQAASPTPSYNNAENGGKSTINSSNLISKLNESDKLITWAITLAKRSDKGS